MVDQVLVLSPTDILDGALDHPILAAGGALDDPAVVVDLDRSMSDATATTVAARVLECDRVVVGRSTRAPDAATRTLAQALDSTVASYQGASIREFVSVEDPDAELAAVFERFHENPYASVVASQVLRLGENLSISEALDVESLAYSTLLGTPDFRRWLEGRGPRPLPPPAPQEPVLIDRRDGLLHITLNRPERRNAYGAQVRDGLVAALQLALMDTSIEKVLLDGAGPSFSAGGDLDEFGTTPDLAIAHLIRTRAGAARLMARLADRIEVHVHGSCVGAGIEVPAFAHTIRAHSSAVFRLPEIGMGLIPGAGGTVSIPRRIGRWRAYHLFVSGSPINADRALEWGLIDQINTE
ncbi:enoyl-CoA hydratase/isomerase family protein [Rhodococcus sp. IEGM 1366]|uniref:enoyl-CoA hydratase/isomerase family protein n=1 Tax=Rhodococcus sp. IEGM 1366 TaxID=3082223 RepID=UPI0029554A19|nr:enoyl-CoA hydratase/isomerase family protein [Rhodococcus sp. IEGM 1366]MDV8071382.1 enoyl-CoA hydratase/isomerase family protein [Rhodococcus sp. IEGM 1366]